MPLLSILIPTYNYNARALVESLLSLARAEHLDAEVLVGDDASTTQTAWLDQLSSQESVRVLRAAHNLGRAANRNRLAEAAGGEWLLFVDCDAAVPSSFSLRTYLAATSSSPVVCGGLLHPSVNPASAATLRYQYERAADLHRAAATRRQQPYAQLSTFSLLVRRDLFLSIRFDEACTEYGYEDTLFGAELHRRGIPICHIDNPLLHLGLEPNEVFIAKTETALRTLRRIAPQLEGHSRLLATVSRLRRLHLAMPVQQFYRLTYKIIRCNLLGSHPSLRLFAFYKLGYYLNIK